MWPLIIRRKFSVPSSVEPSENKFYSGVMEQVKGALTVDLQENAYCSTDPRARSPDSYAVGNSLTAPFSHLLLRTNRFTLGKKGDSESGPEASGTSTKGKKHKKKGNAKSPSSKPPTPEETLTLSMIPVDVLRSWETSFSALLAHEDGIKLFENYLKSEFSEENIQFWMACERFKGLPDHQVEKEAAIIYGEYIDPQASKLVNIDHQTTKAIEDSRERPHRKMFMDAQQSIYLLMARDSFVRFIKSEPFQAAVKR